jgi:hypothetical protein
MLGGVVEGALGADPSGGVVIGGGGGGVEMRFEENGTEPRETGI